MADARNRLRGTTMRELVALQLRLLGFEDAQPRTVQQKLSDRIATDGWEGDVVGVPGWCVSTRADVYPRFGPTLDAARQAAALGGLGRGVVIQHRDRRPASEYLAVLSLGDFAELVLDRERTHE